ncbi:hypothetical protein Golax_017464 [Gossypium laxum]|uniref:Uncharacterized protein n=1 Tax=Gossypium laxum TaxID=34288 RepID=A0A7J8Z0Y8_9ROSI|nr:hypothetical protein [Gossypium laxum]
MFLSHFFEQTNQNLGVVLILRRNLQYLKMDQPKISQLKHLHFESLLLPQRTLGRNVY